jgi:hypothetical protein
MFDVAKATKVRFGWFPVAPYVAFFSVAVFFAALVQIHAAYFTDSFAFALGLLPMAFVVPIGAVACLISSIILAYHRRIAAAIAMFIGPFICAAMFWILTSPPLGLALHHMLVALPDQVATHYVTPERMREAMEMSRDNDSTQVSAWFLEDRGSALAHVPRYLVYDPSEELGRPMRERSPEWKQRVLTLAVMEKSLRNVVQALTNDGWAADSIRLHSHFWVVEVYGPQPRH